MNEKELTNTWEIKRKKKQTQKILLMLPGFVAPCIMYICLPPFPL